ncbi:hypothetical protein [Erysipelothrix rhusiopathiae]|uniref:hypothetical protein n=1 Tax=Erysipelothrix rhusiopathiae TaxID=1648 RepID=UPI003BF48E7A
MKKLVNSTQQKIILGTTVIVVILGIIFGSQLNNKGQKDVYEMQIKYLGGNPDVLKLNMPHTGSGVEISVKKNGKIIKTFDMNESGGKMNLPDLNVEEYDYSKVSYLMTQSQFETDHDFKKGSYPDWQAIAEWHLSNMNETKPFERKAQYLSDDGGVLAEAVIQYIVIDEVVPSFDYFMAGSTIVIKKGEPDLQGKFQEHMKQVGDMYGLEYTDSFTGEVDVNIVGSYPIVVTRTATRNGLSNQINFTIVVEEEKVAVVEQPSTNTSKPTNNNISPSNPSNSQSNNSSSKPNTGGGTSSGSKPTAPSNPNTNGSGSNNSGNNSINGGNTGGGTNNGGGTTNPPQPTRPAPEAPSGMIFYKDYGNFDGCAGVVYAVLEQHVREWNSNFCDDYGYMYYTPNN